MPAGRPLAFQTVEELDSAIETYFESCIDPDGKYIKSVTMTGLAVALDVDRRTLLNYAGREEFFPSITRAKAHCEEFAETQSKGGQNLVQPASQHTVNRV